MDFETALFLLPGLIIGLTVHEAAHAISAKWLGDRTSEKMGRISLNPMRHLSIYGTLALFFLGFGWGKPVIVNLYNFKKPKFYYLLSSLAGPASNLLICGVCLGVLYMHPPRIVFSILVPIFLINGMLAVINLVPIPPLDGSKIWPCLIPGMKPTISGKWSMIWIVVLIIGLQTGGISKVLGPVHDGMWWLLPDYKAERAIKTSMERPDNFPDILKKPSNAKNIMYNSSDPNNYFMFFNVDEKMMGVKAYNEIKERLGSHGWQKLKYSFIEPQKINNGGWEEIDNEKKGYKLYSSMDVWVNSDTGMIMVNRTYTSLDEESEEGIYGYMLNYSRENYGENSTFGIYKKMHPEEFEGI